MRQVKRQRPRANTVERLEVRRFLSAAVNVTVHHGDPSNDGANLAETVLTPGNVNATNFGKRFSTTLDGALFAQPLYVQNVNITRGASPGVHSVAYVATMHDSLYAIDANTGAILWQDSFLNVTDPTAATATTGVTPITTDALNNTSLGKELGILSTPAIDASRGELFLNAATQEVRAGQIHFVQRLWGVSLSDGSAITAAGVIGDTAVVSTATYTSYTGYQYVAGPIVAGTGDNANPTTYPNTDGWVAAPGGATTPVIAFNALIQMGRMSLTLMGGNVYMGFASHNDNGPYYGWLIGFAESSLSLSAAFVTTPTYLGIVGDNPTFTAQGGIWSAGSAMATDGTNLFVTVGNGAFNTDPSNFDANGFPIDHDYADSLLKLQIDPSSTPTSQNGNGWGLRVADYFTPSNAAALAAHDLDLGSGGVTLLPDSITNSAGHPLMIFGGKESRVYVVDRTNLGKFNPTYPTTGDVDPRPYDRVVNEYAGDVINGSAHGVYSAATVLNGTVYVGQAKGPALAFSAADLASGNTPTPLQDTPAFGYPDPTFTVSANGTSNGVLWGANVATSNLLAFDATNVTTPIYDSNTNSADRADVVKFGVVTVANGMAYVTGVLGRFSGYGLNAAYLASSTTTFAAPTQLTAAYTAATVAHLSWTSQSSLAGEFRVDRSTDGTTWTALSYVTGATTAYDDSAITATGSYSYRVVAVAGANVTSASNTATLSPPSTVQPLTGTVIGTAGSYKNLGNTIAKAFDGNLTTYADIATANGVWAGLDLGSTYTVSAVAYASRSGWAGRMNGGMFQGSNTADFSGGVTTLFTIPANANPSSTSLTKQTFTASGPFRYVRYLSPNGGYGNVAELQFFGTPSSSGVTSPLTGSTIGTAGSYRDNGNTAAKVFDGSLSTYFDSGTANGVWAGLDLGSAAVVKQISFAPRSGWASRMVGGMFQVSNTADFSAGVTTLYTITAAPVAGSLTTVTLANTSAFRYVRYLSPNGGFGNIAEMQVFGTR